MTADACLALDQGTTSTRAIVFDPAGRVLGQAQEPLAQHYPADGHVEHDPEELVAAQADTARRALAAAGLAAADVAGAGLTNQRETVVLWERATGRPLHRALVWQDRRTAPACARLVAEGAEELVTRRTGLLLDPYFSATKLAWLLDHVDGARARAARGQLCAGTIDSWLLFRLSGGRVHATDATNASRTALFDIRRQRWDEDLLALFDVPPEVLPEVRDSVADYGALDLGLPDGPVRLRAVIGDQQSAAAGQACFAAGQLKVTYGTGAFLLLVTGDEVPVSSHRLLGTVALRIGGRASYALEGSIFHAGSVVQWLRDGLGLLPSAEASAALAARSDRSRAVHLVPAFTGMGAPHWDPAVRGAIVGLTRDVTAADLVRAGLEAVAFQTVDLLDAMARDGVPAPLTLRVDGGMAANDWFLQCLADACAVPVERPEVTETTALGAASLAGMQAGLFGAPDAALSALSARWRRARRFEPAWSDELRLSRRDAWRAAVARVRGTG